MATQTLCSLLELHQYLYWDLHCKWLCHRHNVTTWAWNATKMWGFHHCSGRMEMGNTNGSPRPGFWFSMSAEHLQMCNSQEMSFWFCLGEAMVSQSPFFVHWGGSSHKCWPRPPSPDGEIGAQTVEPELPSPLFLYSSLPPACYLSQCLRESQSLLMKIKCTQEHNLFSTSLSFPYPTALTVTELLRCMTAYFVLLVK